jgi:phage shock protein E
MKKYDKIIIDVRTPEEFESGHVEGSLNLPLQEIMGKIAELNEYNRPIVLCCASGNRSGQAVMYLKSQGIACENGGSWRDVQKKLQK